ncbi:MAG: Ig-like domain-containing protein [Gemmatimonadota bacterium]
MIQTDERHPPDEVLLAAGLGESSGSTLDADHLARCARCHDRSRQLADDQLAVGELLTLLDNPIPAGAEHPPVAQRPGRVRRVVAVSGGGILLAIAAAAAVIPGSPLRQWLGRDAAPQAREIRSSPPVTPAIVSRSPAASGIAVAAHPSLRVEFTRSQGGGVVELVRSEGNDIAFHSEGGVTAYAVATDQVIIDNQVPAERYRIELPAGVQRVQVAAAGVVLLRWPEDSVRFTVSLHPLRASIPLRHGAAR